MSRIQRKFIESCLLIMLLMSLFMLASLRASGQEPPNSQDKVIVISVDYVNTVRSFITL